MNSIIQRTTILPLLIGSALACFGLLPQMQAVSPAPDGCYPGFTTAEGCNALNFLTTGAGNTGVGWYSLFLDTTGNYNTGLGAGALALNTADSNTAVGAAALLLNTAGHDNTAVGTDALVYNDGGSFNTADGAFALFSNTEGQDNTANGYSALYANTTGNYNTATGWIALEGNTTGQFNTANGEAALAANTTGNFNTANGEGALLANTTGGDNTATGSEALFNNITGNDNTANGTAALANTTGNDNTALGSQAGMLATTGDGNVYIGSGMSGVAAESNHTYIRNIDTTTVSGGNSDAVTIDLNTGLLGHLSSSRRYKEDIQPMDNASEALYQLKPVTYRYKKEMDRTRSLDYGLIAEDVANVDPTLAIRDRKGQIESARYTAINAMLLNEFLKEHRKTEKLEATVAVQQKQIEALTTGLQKVAPHVPRGSRRD